MSSQAIHTLTVWLTEFRKVFYLLFQIIIKDTIWEQLNGRDPWDKVWGNGSTPPYQLFHVFTIPETFSFLCGVLLQSHDWLESLAIGGWFQSPVPHPLSRGWGWGLHFQPSNSMIVSSGYQPLFRRHHWVPINNHFISINLGGILKGVVTNNKRHSYNSRGF